MIEFKNVFKTYNDGKKTKCILSGANWIVNKGELVALKGRSGSGKSTIIKLMLGITKIDKGEIFIDNIPVIPENYQNIRRNLVGVVFQNFNLISNLTVEDNILLPTYFKHKEIDYKNRLKEIMDILEIPIDLLSKEVNILSGGEKQRIAIARSIINGNKILLADEPTGNLDIINENKVMELFKRLRDNFGITIVAVTHSDYLANEMDLVCELENNKVILTRGK